MNAFGRVNPFQMERDFARIQIHPENHDRSILVSVGSALAIEVDVILVANASNLRVEHLPSDESLVEQRHPVILNTKRYTSIFLGYLFIYVIIGARSYWSRISQVCRLPHDHVHVCSCRIS